MARKRNVIPVIKQWPHLRRDVREAVERIWPNGVVDMTFDSEEGESRSLLHVLPPGFVRLRYFSYRPGLLDQAIVVSIAGNPHLPSQ
jgi:hypothetical protein